MLDDVANRLNKFSQLEHMSYLTDTLIPKMEKFSMKIDHFLKQLTETQTIVRNFDKTICNKAEKTDIKLFK